tara:strand:+ start:1469 stop:1936 length:468 start_codon:yes stop_codon:yes gene_type:complete
MGWALTGNTIEYLVANYPKGTRILELGSGDGTKTLLDHGFKVFSIEQDPDWAFKHHKDYILSPLKLTESGKWWFDPEDLQDDMTFEYDLLLIDGPTGHTPDYDNCRQGILDHLDLFDLTVPILVDDVDRPEELELFNILSKGRESSLHGRFGMIL